MNTTTHWSGDSRLNAETVQPSRFDRFAPMVVLAVLGVALPVGVWLTVPAQNQGLAEIAPFSVVLYATVRLASLSGDRGSRPISLTFWIFVYVFFGLAGMAQLRAGQFPSVAISYESHDVAGAYASIWIGMLAFDLASTGRVARPPRLVASALAWPVRTGNVVALAGIGAIAAIAVAQLLGGLGVIFQPRAQVAVGLARLADAPLEIASPLSALMRVPISVAFLAVLALSTAAVRNRLPLPVFYKRALAATGIAAVIVANPISTPRYWIGTILVAALFILFPSRVGLRSAIITLVLTLALVLVFPVADLYRRSLETSPLAAVQVVEPFADLASNGDFDAVQQVAGAVGYVSAEGHSLGRQTAGVLLFWVPRSAWTNKPDASAHVVARFMGLPSVNVSMPLWGTYYLDGGVPMVAFGFLLYGFGVGYLERIYMRRQSTPVTLVGVLVPLLAGYQFFLLRGDTLSAVAYLVPALLAALVLVIPRRELD